MAVGKKKKEEIDKNRRKQTNLLEFAAKNKEKRKKNSSNHFAVDTFWRENILPRFFSFSCDRRLEIPNWSAQNTTVQLFERKKRKNMKKT